MQKRTSSIRDRLRIPTGPIMGSSSGMEVLSIDWLLSFLDGTE